MNILETSTYKIEEISENELSILIHSVMGGLCDLAKQEDSRTSFDKFQENNLARFRILTAVTYPVWSDVDHDKFREDCLALIAS